MLSIQPSSISFNSIIVKQTLPKNTAKIIAQFDRNW